MKKYTLSKPEKYTKDGAEKTYWANVGTMIEFSRQDGTLSRIIEIPAIWLKANIFEIQPKVTQAPVKKQEDIYPIENNGSIELPTDDINPDDIPF